MFQKFFVLMLIVFSYNIFMKDLKLIEFITKHNFNYLINRVIMLK